MIPGTSRSARPEPEEPDWANDWRFYREFQTPRGPQRYYTVGALAAALGKSPVTVRTWIRKGVIPDASYRTGPISRTLRESGRRLYSREQIEALVSIALTEGVIGDGRIRTHSFRESGFSNAVHRYWRHRNW